VIPAQMTETTFPTSRHGPPVGASQQGGAHRTHAHIDWAQRRPAALVQPRSLWDHRARASPELRGRVRASALWYPPAVRDSAFLREAFPEAQTRDGISFHVHHSGVWVRLEPIFDKGRNSLHVTIPLRLPLPIYGTIARSVKTVGEKTFASGDPSFDARFTLSGAPRELWREIIAVPMGPALVQAFDDHAVWIWVHEGELRTTAAHLTLIAQTTPALVAQARARLSAAATLAARIEGVLQRHADAAQRAGTLPALADRLQREVDATRRAAKRMGMAALVLLLLLIFGGVGWIVYSNM